MFPLFEKLSLFKKVKNTFTSSNTISYYDVPYNEVKVTNYHLGLIYCKKKKTLIEIFLNTDSIGIRYEIIGSKEYLPIFKKIK